jgi:hypothetical protein
MKQLKISQFAAIGGALLALTLSVGALSPAHAESVPQTVNGNFTVTSTSFVDQQTVGGNCVIHLKATFEFLDSLTGSFSDAPFTFVQIDSCSGTRFFVARGTYHGSVTTRTGTRSGSFDFVFAGTIDTQENARGNLTVLRGGGGLSGIRGTITLAGKAGQGGTYTGVVQFDD